MSVVEAYKSLIAQQGLQIMEISIEDATDELSAENEKLRAALPLKIDFASFMNIVMSLPTPRIFLVKTALSDGLESAFPNYKTDTEQAEDLALKMDIFLTEYKDRYSAEFLRRMKEEPEFVICNLFLYALVDGVFVSFEMHDLETTAIIQEISRDLAH